MIAGYWYRLWNGKEFVGECHFSSPLQGTHVVVPEISFFKGFYRKKEKTIKFPLEWISVEDRYNKKTFEQVINVKRKSNRQIEILKNRGYGLQVL